MSPKDRLILLTHVSTSQQRASAMRQRVWGIIPYPYGEPFLIRSALCTMLIIGVSSCCVSSWQHKVVGYYCDLSCSDWILQPDFSQADRQGKHLCNMHSLRLAPWDSFPPSQPWSYCITSLGFILTLLSLVLIPLGRMWAHGDSHLLIFFFTLTHSQLATSAFFFL